MLALPVAAQAQRTRDSLGVAAERDGGEKKRPDGVSFAGEARVRVEVQDKSPSKLEPGRSDALAYYRLLGSVDARAGPVRAYVQLGTRLESGLNGPRQPISTDRFDVQQAFADLDVGPEGRRIRLRGGRQEVSFEFVSNLDSPNVRRSWDGGRATLFLKGWEAEAFSLGLVRPGLGVLDDSSHRSDRFDGVHLISPDRAIGPFYLSAYYYDVRQANVRLLPEPASAHTQTWGGALDGAIGSVTLRLSGVRQMGRFGERRVDAFAYEAVAGLDLETLAWKPTIALRTDGFSGGAPRPDRIRTFNPLFPNDAYSTEAVLQTPSNLRKAGIDATAKPSSKVQLRYRGEGLWRYSAADAFYLSGNVAPIPPDGSRDRWIGLQQQLAVEWTASEALTVKAAYVNFRPGEFIRRAGRTGQNFGMMLVEWRFGG